MKKRDRKYRRGKRGRLHSTASRIPSCSFSVIVSAPIISSLSLMATPSTSSSPAASTNFQLVLSDDNESSGYFTLKPASRSKDKKISMECKVILEKLPPTNATVFILQEHESFGIPSSSRGKAVRGGKGRRSGTGRKFKIQDHESFEIPSSSREKAVRVGKGRRAGTGRNPGKKN